MAVKYHMNQFPPENLDWEQLVPLIGKANRVLAKYDALLETIPDSSVLLSPLQRYEAVLSSKIEGTQATLVEVLEHESGKKSNPSRIEDIKEIINYRNAVIIAEERLRGFPLSGRLLRDLHKHLMQNVRGKNRAPGQYRTNQNWIGPKGCSIEEARYVPIESQYLGVGMQEWENFLHSDYKDPLVQLAIIHAEFESLHPFYDGNGRLGRMLIPLFLYDKKIISAPSFYMSQYLESNREEYYDTLLEVSKSNNWNMWCIYFLKAVIEQSMVNYEKAHKILQLNEGIKEVIKTMKSKYSLRIIDFVFCNPIFYSNDFIKNTNIPSSTAKRILKNLCECNILFILEESSGSRPTMYLFAPLMKIVQK